MIWRMNSLCFFISFLHKLVHLNNSRNIYLIIWNPKLITSMYQRSALSTEISASSVNSAYYIYTLSFQVLSFHTFNFKYLYRIVKSYWKYSEPISKSKLNGTRLDITMYIDDAARTAIKWKMLKRKFLSYQETGK